MKKDILLKNAVDKRLANMFSDFNKKVMPKLLNKSMAKKYLDKETFKSIKPEHWAKLKDFLNKKKVS